MGHGAPAEAGGHAIDTILTLFGIFAGVGVFLSVMYSVSQILMLEGRGRAAHAILLGLILAVMAALMERAVPLARLLAAPLAAVAFWTLVLEPRWYRVFPLIVIAFAAVLMAGYVAMG